MTRLASLSATIVLAVLLVEPPSAASVAVVTDRVLVPRVTRFGLNLGGWSNWGPDQFSSNIVKNPGFEGLIDGAIVMPAHTSGASFDDSPAWLARPAGFWDGARFSIRSGPHAGREGTVARSIPLNEWGLPAFTASAGDVAPQTGEATALVKVTETALPTQWWYSKEPGDLFAPELKQPRPESPGLRSLRIGGSGMRPAVLSSWFDSMGPHVGKLLPLGGTWTLSFWTRLDKGSATLKVSFEREGSRPVLSRDVPLSAAWNNVKLTFSAEDSGPHGTAALKFQVAGTPEGEILLDDIDLRRTEDAAHPFRHEVISMLERLHPASLREWQGQLADTLANRTAGQFARRAWRSRPGDDTQTDFGYGLGDFLDLCIRVHAAPWLIVPPVFTDAECEGYGSYLAARRDLATLPEILLEFGNENWNPTFRPTGIPDPVAHGQAAGRCFAAIRSHAPGLNLKTVTNAQAGYPEGALQYARASRNTDIVAVAPYFFYSLSAGLPLEARISSLFQRNRNMPTLAGAMPALNKELAVYETNLHTVEGDAPPEDRKPVVAGLAAGSALARNMLDSLMLGVRRQCVYTLTGLENQLSSRPGTVPLWGIARDVGPTQRLRPTGLALQLMNQVLSGDMMAVVTRGSTDVSTYAFRTPRGWAAIVVSSAASDRKVTLRLPKAADRLLTLQRLSSQSRTATNEESEEVRITREKIALLDSSVNISLSPWGMAVLLPQEMEK